MIGQGFLPKNVPLRLKSNLTVRDAQNGILRKIPFRQKKEVFELI